MTDSRPHRETSPTPEIDKPIRERLDRIWKRAYRARTRDDLRRLYADWARSYDQDHEAIGFFGHRTAARVLARYTSRPALLPVLDAGAGTGAAGEALASIGYRNLTAVDLSCEMLEHAGAKGVYRDLHVADLGEPLDLFPANHFAGCILVGVFSYGQAPAHALDEILRVVRPGGVIVFTLRTDFHEEDAMEVRSRMKALEASGAWRLLERTQAEAYLPRKDPAARFRVWCYRVLPSKVRPIKEDFANAVRSALDTEGPVKRIDHRHIWDSTASRLYERYTACDDYYLTDCEEEILRDQGREIAGKEDVVIELGCGSARKIQHVLRAALAERDGKAPLYLPVDISPGALAATRSEVERLFAGKIPVEPRCGHFDVVLPALEPRGSKAIFFFGSSLGNIETLEETVRFLSRLREMIEPGERLVIGLDLDKDDEILRRAYEAGPPNRSFFLNMLRRINHELGGNLELDAFRQRSTCDEDEPFRGLTSRCVNLQLETTEPQEVYVRRLDIEAHLDPGDAVQVGTSRKFRPDAIRRLGALSGLQLRRQWFDARRWFSLNEFVREEAVH